MSRRLESAAGWRLPAEWEPHDRTWMAWPCRAEAFRGAGVAAARLVHAEVARAISAFEPVTLLCRPGDVVEASLACGSGIDVLPMPLSDSWTRDTAPTFLVSEAGGLAGIDWIFNGWGGVYPDHAEDADLARALLDHLDLPRLAAPLVLEGGAIATDGAGTLMVTEQCLLDPGRNPGLSRDEVEAHLLAATNARKVVWLGEGYEGDETKGHIDEIALFVRPGVVLALDTEDTADPNYPIFKDNLARLAAARDAAGRTLEIGTLPLPARREVAGERLTLSYANLYIANGGVIMPQFGDAADDVALRIVRRAFPEREIVPLPVLDLVQGGGGIHCITQQQPRG